MSNFITVNRPFNDLTTSCGKRQRVREKESGRDRTGEEKEIDRMEDEKQECGARSNALRLACLSFIPHGKAAKTRVYKSYAKTRWKRARGRALNLVNLDFIR